MAEPQIHRALCPRVAVLSSPDVDDLVHANDLDDLASLLRPFENSVERLSVRTSQLETRLCETFPLQFASLESFGTPGDGRRDVDRPEQLLDAVSAHVSANARRWSGEVECRKLTGPGDVDREWKQKPIEEITPWFTDFRNMVLRHRIISEHETFGHPVAMLLAVSSTNPDPMNAFAQLYETSQTSEAYSVRPYMDPHVLRYYVLLHDISRSGPELGESVVLLETIKKTYGLHCCLLPINSATSSTRKSNNFPMIWQRALHVDPRAPLLTPNIATPAANTPGLEKDPRGPQQSASSRDEWRRSLGLSADSQIEEKEYGKLLDDEDVRRLKGFIRELTAQSLVPFMERSVQQWNEQLSASRRGLTGRLFSVGRKYFGSNKAGSQTGQGGQAPGYNSTQNYYPFAATEAQTRRLADFAFMTRDYKLAVQMYDIGRRDYAGDKAWRYSAGATEMFGLSHLMIMLSTRSPPIDVDSYLVQACAEYQSRSTVQLNSLRATLLYYEAYRALDHYRSAPYALIRAAGEAEEVSSALLLEQAALADLRLPHPATRKFALHSVMAAHRYQACGQKHLSLRCYDQALALYRGKSWVLVEDHIEHELGRQAYNDGDSEQAVSHLVTLLRPELSHATEHASYLEEFVTAFKFIDKDPEQIVSQRQLALPTPLFDVQQTAIRVTHERNASGAGIGTEDDEGWASLEQRFLASGFGGQNNEEAPEGQTSRKRKRPASLARSSEENVAATGDTFFVDLMACNPINTTLTISDVRLVVVPEGTADTETVEVDECSKVVLGPAELRPIRIGLRSSKPGKFRVTDVHYCLQELVPLTQSLEKQGKRLNATKAQRIEPTYAPDNSLCVTVREPKPSLSISLLEAPASMLSGEECLTTMVLRNSGQVDLTDLRVLVNSSSAIHIRGDATEIAEAAPMLVLSNDLADAVPVDLSLPANTLSAGAEFEVPVVLRGSTMGAVDLRWLFVFEAGKGEYLTSRYAHRVQVDPVLDVAVHCRPSKSSDLAYTLSLEVGNLFADMEDVRVSRITFISPFWSLATHTALLKEQAFSTIAPMQTSTSFMTIKTATRSETAQSDGVSPITNLDYTVAKLRALLQGRNNDLVSTPGKTALYCSAAQPDEGTADHLGFLSSFLRPSRAEWRRHILAAQFPTIPAAELPRIFTLYEPRDVDVIVSWEVPAQERRGHLHIFGLTPGPSFDVLKDLTGGDTAAIRSMYEQAAREKAALLTNLLSSRLHLDENPLEVEVQVEDVVRHDFAQGRLRLPVTFLLRNMSTNMEATFSIHLETGNDEELPTHDSHVAAPWLGRLTLRGTLAPQSTGSMTAHACIEREGVAELGRCMLRTSLQPAKPERDTSQDAVAPSLGAAGPTFVIPVSSSRIVRALQL